MGVGAGKTGTYAQVAAPERVACSTSAASQPEQTEEGEHSKRLCRKKQERRRRTGDLARVDG